MKNNENIIIDIGSNTLKITIFNEKREKIKNFNIVTSLAFDIVDDMISENAIKRLFDAFDFVCKKYSLAGAKCVATAVFRKCKNAQSLALDIEKKYGFKVNIISPKQEALLSKKGVLSYGIKNALIVDLGGASTEFILDNESVSFDFGIVSFYRDFLKLKSGIVKPKKSSSRKLFKRKIANDDKKALYLARQITANAREYLRDKSFKNIVLCSKICIYNKSLKEKIPYEKINEEKYINTKITKKDLAAQARKLYNINNGRARFYVGDNKKEFLIFGILLLFGIFENKNEFVCFDDALKYGILNGGLDV